VEQSTAERNKRQKAYQLLFVAILGENRKGNLSWEEYGALYRALEDISKKYDNVLTGLDYRPESKQEPGFNIYEELKKIME